MLFDYINCVMLFLYFKLLMVNQVYVVVVYVLNFNDIVLVDFVVDKNMFFKVKMFVYDKVKLFFGLMSVMGMFDVKNVVCMKDCVKDVKVIVSLFVGFVENLYGDICDNFCGLQMMNEQVLFVFELLGYVDVKVIFDVFKLFGIYVCSVCYVVDYKVVGLVFQDVVVKYQGNVGVVQYLMDKICKGGVGVWGLIFMLLQFGLFDVELVVIIYWVLSQFVKK